uniref:Sec-independent protein translocase component TatC n=1 Tax=Crouania attenuata TaxID=42002 RepID=A0A4D6WP28_9FLOR|nr:Sec-independent protein translocase component TatC [Crouania attenuata]
MKPFYHHNQDQPMPIIEHLKELRLRILTAFLFFILITFTCFLYNQNIALFIQEPAYGIKFLQLAPGEYLFASIKLSIYFGCIISSPFTVYQIILFVLPALTSKERKYLIPLLTISILLFYIGFIFSYKILTPAALKFLINYGSNIIEPIWSFDEYLNFISILLISTGLAFQIPIIQIILGYFNILSSTQMLSYWKYMIFFSTIISAIITPSTDPITQITMTFAILTLYTSGIIFLKIIKK